MFVSLSSKGLFVKKQYLVNENIVHLVDNIFWHMGFKTPSDAEKVITRNMLIMLITYARARMNLRRMLAGGAWRGSDLHGR